MPIDLWDMTVSNLCRDVCQYDDDTLNKLITIKSIIMKVFEIVG